ncbi:MAG: hypothetical protein JEY99_07985 [Spirochaetales bacterium]|nr:hypothetical protein [Spirochaetales bacterium]
MESIKTKTAPSPWWRETSIYQIYPRSFAGTGNSTGNLKGIIKKLDYIKSLGIETIWLSPIYPSPQADFGYDITDYRGINPEYGTMDDFQELLREIHDRGMKLLMDMVLNHTSNEHPWFIESSSSKKNSKRDWYVWRDGKKTTRNNPGGRKPPNNWKSQVSGSGWQKDKTTNQWYWASFLPFQPDLNWRNEEVRIEMFQTLRFWLDRGVDGFRLDILGSVYEDPLFRDNPRSLHYLPSKDGKSFLFQTKLYTENHMDNFALAKDLRQIVDSYTDSPRMLIGEVFGEPEVIRKFCGESKQDGLNSVFLFKAPESPFAVKPLKKILYQTETTFPDPWIPTLAFSNHDRIRRVSALNGNENLYKMSLLFQATARGIPCFYFGEEIGQPQAYINHKDSLDAVCAPFKKLPPFIFRRINRRFHSAIHRDECRTPMHWSPNPNGGFCPEAVTPWLPLQKDYPEINVENQEEELDSLLHWFQKLMEIRKATPSLYRGEIEIIEASHNCKKLPKRLLAYRKIDPASGSITAVYLNFSKNTEDTGVEVDSCIEIFSTNRIQEKNSTKEKTIKIPPQSGLIVKFL